MHVNRTNERATYRMGKICLGTTIGERLRVLVDHTSNVNQQCDVLLKASAVLKFVNRSIEFRKGLSK